MKNLQSKTKAELIEIIKKNDCLEVDVVADFAEQLKTFFNGYQVGLLTKLEICHGINRVYDAFIFAKGVGKDDNT